MAVLHVWAARRCGCGTAIMHGHGPACRAPPRGTPPGGRAGAPAPPPRCRRRHRSYGLAPLGAGPPAVPGAAAFGLARAQACTTCCRCGVCHCIVLMLFSNAAAYSNSPSQLVILGMHHSGGL